MKSYKVEISLFDDWDIALREEYSMAFEALKKIKPFTYEEFLSVFIQNILEGAETYEYIDAYASRHAEIIKKKLNIE